MFRRILTILCLVGVPIAGRSQVFWQKTAYGMSPEEVVQAVPDARAPADQKRMKNGSLELLRVEQFPLVDRSFDVHFFFDSQRLVQVMLSLRQTKDDSYHSCSLVFDSLTNALRAKYGAELSKSKKEDGGFRLVQSEWLSGKTNVSILLMDAYGVLALNVNYDVRLSKEAEKL